MRWSRPSVLLALIHDWRGDLSTADTDGASEQRHFHSRTGRPLGCDDFVKRVEARLVRLLRPREPGPKPTGTNHQTGDLFAVLDSERR